MREKKVKGERERNKEEREREIKLQNTELKGV